MSNSSLVHFKDPPGALVVAIAKKLDGTGENRAYHVKVEQNQRFPMKRFFY